MAAKRILRGALFFLPALVMAAGESGSVRSYALPGHGLLTLKAPGDWRGTLHRPPADWPPIIDFSPASGNDFSVRLTPIWSPAADPEFNRPATIRAFVERMGRNQMGQAVERDVRLKEMKGARGSGYLFTLTDRAPAEGEWKYLTAGALGVGDLLLSFTILTNSLDSDVLREALRMIETSEQVKSAEPDPPRP